MAAPLQSMSMRYALCWVPFYLLLFRVGFHERRYIRRRNVVLGRHEGRRGGRRRTVVSASPSRRCSAESVANCACSQLRRDGVFRRRGRAGRAPWRASYLSMCVLWAQYRINSWVYGAHNNNPDSAINIRTTCRHARWSVPAVNVHISVPYVTSARCGCCLQGRRSWAVRGVLIPLKIMYQGQSIFSPLPPKNVTFFHSKLSLDNSASFTSSRMKDFVRNRR